MASLLLLFLLQVWLGSGVCLGQTAQGWALSFDGVDDVVVIPHSDVLNAFPLTATAWIRTSETTGFRFILSKSLGWIDGYQMVLENGELRGRYARDSLNYIPADSTGPFVADGEWHQVAFVADTNGGSLFVDGNLRHATPWWGSPGPTTTTANLVLGRDPRSALANRFWRGLIDEVAIWRLAGSEVKLRENLYRSLTDSEQGLAGYWRMDEGNGFTLADETSNQPGEVSTNGPAWLMSLIPASGSALHFGDEAAMRTPGLGRELPTDEVTVEFWAKLSAVTNQQLFSLSPDDSAHRMRARIPWGDGRIYWEFGDPDAGGLLVYNPPERVVGTWQHFALVSSRSGNSMSIYRNGQLEATKVGASALAPGDYDLLIGGFPDLFTRGELDEFRIWNVARTQTEVQAYMNRRPTSFQPGLVVYYRFDDLSGSVAADSSGHGFMGFLSNQTTWAVSPLCFPPEVVTLPASNINLHSAALNCLIDANGLPTIASFQWGEGTNYAHNEPVDAGVAASTNLESVVLTGLASGVPYHFRIVATNAAGFSLGADQIFYPSLPPVANTLAPTYVGAVLDKTHATLRGDAVPNWSPTLVWFEWGTSPAYDKATEPTNIGTASSPQYVEQRLTGLPANAVYHYRVVASNTVGVAFGQDQTFSAPGILLNGPEVITIPRGEVFTDPGAGSLQPIVSIAAGIYHALALTYDGKVIAWGAGQTNGPFPDVGQSMVPQGLSDVIAIDAGDMHSLALRRDGTVVAWGDSLHYGETRVPPGLSNVVAISGGGRFSLALQHDGRLVGWGESPLGGVYTAPDLTHIVAIAAGSLHSTAIRDDGTLALWGFAYAWPPPDVSNLVAISSGHGNDLALKSDGTVVGWGGDVPPPPGLSNISAVATGARWFSVALRRDGTVVGWGSDNFPVPPGLSNVVAITVGYASALALDSNGKIVGWGRNENDMLNPPPDLAQAARKPTVTGAVNTERHGLYTLIYSVTNALGIVGTATRTVVVADPIPRLFIDHLNGRSLIVFTAAPGEDYAIDSSVDLREWARVGQLLVGADGVFQFEDIWEEHLSAKFYRIRLIPSENLVAPWSEGGVAPASWDEPLL